MKIAAKAGAKAGAGKGTKAGAGGRAKAAARKTADAAEAAETAAEVHAKAQAQAGSGAAPPPDAGPGLSIGGSLSATPGPWFTCGLGGSLLASSAVAFGIVVAIVYAGAGYLMWLLISLLAWLWCPGSCTFTMEPCSNGYHPGPCCNCGASASGSSGSCCGGSGSSSGSCCGSGSSSGGSSGSCCGSGSSTTGSLSGDVGGKVSPPGFLAPVAGLGIAAWLRAVPGRLDALLAHHPPTPAFRADVFRVGSVRFCVGCFTTFPLFLAASAWLALAPSAPAGVWLAPAGLALAAAQAISSLGWARRRAVKVLVKASLGVGLALFTHGILTSGWSQPAQVAALLAALVLAWLSAVPRRRRIARAAGFA